MAALAFVLLAVLVSPETEAQTPGFPCLKRERGDSFDCVCNDSYCDTLRLPQTLQPGWFYAYTSSASTDRFKLRMTRPQYNPNTHSDLVLTVSPENVRQEILGFGGALTDATAYNLKMLPHPAQTKFLDSYFSKDGIEYSFVRVPIGGTDFSPRYYTNMNRSRGFYLTEEDCFLKIPYLQDILERNDYVRMLGSSWFAPEWMLKKDKYGRDVIHPKFYRAWAEYHKSFLDSYKGFGINFWGATTGNEIVLGIFSVPWSMDEHQIWINEHLGPVLEQSGYGDLKLLLLDDQTPYLVPWLNLFHDNITDRYIDGVALHWYIDRNTYLILDAFHAHFSNKLILNTESSICKYERNYEEKLQWYGAELYAENIIEKMNSYSSGWIDWNLALDLNGGPNFKNNTCTAAVIVDPEHGEFYKGPIFYAIGHFSKFVPPGSRSVYSSLKPESRDILAAAFAVGDRPWDIAVVLLNKLRKEVDVQICIGNGYCGVVQMQPRSIVSVIADTTPENYNPDLPCPEPDKACSTLIPNKICQRTGDCV